MRTPLALVTLSVLLFVSPLACSDGDAPAATTSGPGDGGGSEASVTGEGGTVATDGAATPDGASVTPDADADAAVGTGAPPSILPVSYERTDVGTPVSAAELATATDELIALMKDTRYFDFVDERVHGWPETDPAGGYWYGHFWTGVTVQKSAGKVTYKHSNDGADNVGIHTAPYLEGACYGYLLWGDPKVGHLVRRMARAYTAWSLAMVRSAGDTNPTLLARSFYRPNVESTEGGRALTIDYSPSYPGVDANPSEYVHVPSNPTFGDIYVKNKRSKDDIGHMLRSLEQIRACSPRLPAAGQTELAAVADRYKSWAARVDSQSFGIETLDKSQNLWMPPDQLAHYTLAGNLECLGALSVRLTGSGAPGNLDCGNGMTSIEMLGWPFLKNDARQIVRTHHVAAIVHALRAGQNPLALSLLQGMGQRIDTDIGYADTGSPPSGFVQIDVGSELVMAANAGVPLTSREVRWLHGRLHEAYVGMRDAAFTPIFKTFDPATPDGTYSFDPPNIGLFYKDLGMMLGACASPYRNPKARPLLDCQKLATAF